ncbi:MAG: aminopeptidase [Prevotellaceae bacterium]|jgi:bleomycin hydrolase|nr:aminopeptidase [Prevotellaceae bacterium]
MKREFYFGWAFVCLLALSAPTLVAQYEFTPVVDIKVTPVKNQSRTGTCWCFATNSFFEAELIRMNKGAYDLSEMFIVRNTYMERLNDNYLRRGNGNLGPGSVSNVYVNTYKKYGIVPQEVYNGLVNGATEHNHGELQRLVEAVAKVAVDLKKRSPEYEKVIQTLFDIYLGTVPEKFVFKGKEFTPQTFAASLGLQMEDYVEITSFTHIPLHAKGVLEIPDNWQFGASYNVTLDELITIMDNALNKGFTVAWDGDVSERGFSHINGIAINPQMGAMESFEGTDRARFENLSSDQLLAEMYKFFFEKPFPEVKVTPEIRQAGYESFVTTDDHLMHLTGIVKDQNGTKYYKTKNSWGTERNKFDGYLNMSESYVSAKTIAIMVHKDAIPTEIRKKLGL